MKKSTEFLDARKHNNNSMGTGVYRKVRRYILCIFSSELDS